MLMLMKSQAEAMRALAYTTAAAMDFAHKSEIPPSENAIRRMST